FEFGSHGGFSFSLEFRSVLVRQKQRGVGP
ncbi:MAG: hypothetical protein QOG55_1128, partial [Acidobacteriaceae bacterium]|nr:hypothetical protein [Acidobacteriaceae bacterium]